MPLFSLFKEFFGLFSHIFLREFLSFVYNERTYERNLA